MVLIWGHKYALTFLCKAAVGCPECNQAPTELHYGRKKFTLYWMPTFTTSEGYFLKCPHCRGDQLYSIESDVAEEIRRSGSLL